MSTESWALFYDVVLAILATLLGSLFAGADAALSAIPDARLHALMGESPRVARAFGRYVRDPVRVTSRWLVARVLCIGFATALGYEGAQRVGLTGLRTALSVLGVVASYGTFAEIACIFAKRRPERAGALALRYLLPFEWVVIPLAAPLALLGQAIADRLPSTSRLGETAEHEVAWAVREGEKSGEIAIDQGEMIRAVLDFKEVQARNVMVPRARTHAIDADTPLVEVFGLAAREGHSRYPIFRGTIDHVVGLLYVKDLFAVVRDRLVPSTKLTDIMRSSVLYVSETQPAAQILREMRVKRMHLAVVVDEFGGTSGIITLEDIIEEIVGDIRDEYEKDTPIRTLGEGHLLVDAALPIADVSAHLPRPLPEDGEVESVGGLIVDHVGRVPVAGVQVILAGFKLTVREADERRVLKVEILDVSGTPEGEGLGREETYSES